MRSAKGTAPGSRQHVDHLVHLGVPAVDIDPDPETMRARGAFARPGFERAAAPLDTRWDRAMLLHRFA
ncbi:hypothetical protein [Methylobacterium isbiliense]|uniref:hypothetical protein n=1 Tax=Methylobacterium isbiliense TaxID=315478 RepID=UPI001EE1DD11|nr:hypothetical protein [Methylobacterium isbiliense]MDN3622461.1 hypothetical protein [Methylobacterium isbiliense]